MFGSSSAPSHLRMVVRPSGGAAWHRPGPKPRAAESALSALSYRRQGRVELGWVLPPLRCPPWKSRWSTAPFEAIETVP